MTDARQTARLAPPAGPQSNGPMSPRNPAEPARPEPSPITLGPFTVGRVIGRGAMGAVFAARHGPTGTPAAIKVLQARFRGERQRAAFRHEVERMAALDHPRIVPIFDHGRVPDRPLGPSTTRSRLLPGAPYLVMAHAELGSLAERAERLDWPSVAAIIGGVLDGLAHAHARGLVHCDLKPENVLLAATPDGIRPLLADFGISHAFREADRDSVQGTPPFMAPEQFHQPRDIGPWTDLYALGCLAWVLVCHAQPYTARTPLAYAVAHVSGPRPTPEAALVGVPDAMADWLLRLLERDWRDRFRSAAAARAALAGFAPLDAEVVLPAGGSIATAETLADDGDLTTTLDGGDWQPTPGASPARDVHPPLPDDWRPPEGGRSPRLEGAGRALFGLRVPPFTGREAERDRVWRALGDVHRGARRLVVVRGAAGTGKSRLARWMLERAEELGVALSAVLDHHRPALPDDGLAGTLRRLIRPTGGEADLERIARLRGAATPDAVDGVVARLCNDGLDGPTLPPRRRYRAAAALLEGLAAGRPLMLLVDDAQWGAPALDFAQHLLDDGPPCLVLLTVRTDEAPPPLLAKLGDRPEAAIIELAPLDGETHAALVERLLPLEPQTAARVVARTAGHPLFAMQLLGEWLRRGALVAGEHGFAVTAEAADAVPASLPALWGPRLDRLEPDARAALDVGAVLGERVGLRPWRAACDAVGIEPPADLLERATRAGLIRGERDGWRFAHGLLRDTVLGLVAPRRLRALHRACALGLESGASGRSPAAMARIAEHWIAADVPASALGPLRAGAWLLIDRMHRDPVRPLIERHDALLDGLGAADDDARRARSGVLRAFLAFADADLDAARVLFDRCRPIIERHGLESERGRLLRLRGMMARQTGDLDVAERFLRAAEIQCAGAGLIVEAGKAALGRAEVHRRRGEQAECRAAIDAAVARFTAAADRFWLDTSRMEQVRLLRFDGRLDEAAALALDVARQARRSGDEANEARGLHTHAIIARMLRRMPEAEETLAAAQTIYARTGNINGLILDGERAIMALIAGRLDDAATLAARAAAALESTMWADAQPTNELILAVDAVRRGDGPTADRLLARVEQIGVKRERSYGDVAELVAAALTAAGDGARSARVCAYAAEVWRAVGEPARAAALSAR